MLGFFQKNNTFYDFFLSPITAHCLRQRCQRSGSLPSETAIKSSQQMIKCICFSLISMHRKQNEKNLKLTKVFVLWRQSFLGDLLCWGLFCWQHCPNQVKIKGHNTADWHPLKKLLFVLENPRKMPFYEGIGLIAEKNGIVLDVGSCQTKVGYAGESCPRAVLPTPPNLASSLCPARMYDALVGLIHEIYFKHLLVNPKDRRVVLVDHLLGKYILFGN